MRVGRSYLHITLSGAVPTLDDFWSHSVFSGPICKLHREQSICRIDPGERLVPPDHIRWMLFLCYATLAEAFNHIPLHRDVGCTPPHNPAGDSCACLRMNVTPTKSHYTTTTFEIYPSGDFRTHARPNVMVAGDLRCTPIKLCPS
ncbi:hypothetical protein HanIR_Chr01g0040741 [Helianthus annuus]|nr:hypothetical protein HanIR_Chr01g0040741 [Helianthus annuus]